MNGIPGNTLPSESSFEALLRCLDIQGSREIVRIGGGGYSFPQYIPRSYVGALGFILGIFQLFIPELSCSVYFIEHQSYETRVFKKLNLFQN